MAICGLAQTTNLLKGKLACSSMARPVHLCGLSMPSSKSLCCMLSTFPDCANYMTLTANPWLAPLSQSPASAALCKYDCSGCVAPVNYSTMGPPQCISPIQGLLQCPATPMNNALKQQQAAYCFVDPAVPDSDRQGHRRVSYSALRQTGAANTLCNALRVRTFHNPLAGCKASRPVDIGFMGLLRSMSQPQEGLSQCPTAVALTQSL